MQRKLRHEAAPTYGPAPEQPGERETLGDVASLFPEGTSVEALKARVELLMQRLEGRTTLRMSAETIAWINTLYAQIRIRVSPWTELPEAVLTPLPALFYKRPFVPPRTVPVPPRTVPVPLLWRMLLALAGLLGLSVGELAVIFLLILLLLLLLLLAIGGGMDEDEDARGPEREPERRPDEDEQPDEGTEPDEDDKRRRKRCGPFAYPIMWPIALHFPTQICFVRVKSPDRDYTGENQKALKAKRAREAGDPDFQSAKYHIHHVVPLFLGGQDALQSPSKGGNGIILPARQHLSGHRQLQIQPQMEHPPPPLLPINKNIYKHPVGTLYYLAGFKTRYD